MGQGSGDAELLRAEDAICSVPAENGAGGGRVVFDHLALHLRAGEIVDLTGPSGSGKSMLLLALARLTPHATATLSLRGRSAAAYTPEEWRARVAYLPQRPVLTGETLRAAILLPFDLRVRAARRGGTGARATAAMAGAGSSSRPASARPDDDALRRALDYAGLEGIGLNHDPQELSVGQQARVCLIRTLLTAPDVLLADEVDAGLDAASANRVGEMLARAAAGGMAVLRVRHHEPDGRAARTLVLEGGRLAEKAGFAKASSSAPVSAAAAGEAPISASTVEEAVR